MKIYTFLFYFQWGYINALWFYLHGNNDIIICIQINVSEVLRDIYFSKLVTLNSDTLKLNDKPYMYTFILLSVCPSIANCLEMHCYDSADSTICANCEGVVKDAPYYRAYKRSDDKKKCLRK